jgi:hypothetical protein
MKEKLHRHRNPIDDVRAEMAPFRVEPSRIEPDAASALAAIARQDFLRGNRLELLIDGDATFGAILDEITLAVADQGFAAEVATMFDRDFADSREVGPRAYDTPPFHFKVGAKAARLLAPVL